LQGFEQIFRFHIFQQIAVSATFKGGHHVLFMIRHAEHHNAPGKRFFPQLVQRFKAVHAGHIEIQQNQIGIE